MINISSYEKINDNKNLFYDFKSYIDSLIKNNSSKDYVFAFVLGDMRYVSSDMKMIYQNLGISHLFSVSGMHISILSGFILFILKKLKCNEEIRYFISCIFIIFFMFLVNLVPAVLRSGIFFVLVVINNIYYFHIKSINLLLLTISLIMFINPYIIYNNGFLFSSIVTGSLIVFSFLINNYSNYIMKLFMTSLIAFIFSFPLSIYSSYQINVLSVIYNLLFVPFISFIVFPLSLICLFLPFLSNILNIFIAIMEKFALWCSYIDSNIIFSKPSISILFLYYILLFFLVYYRKRFIYMCVGIFIFIHYNYNIIFPGNYIMMIDVGQGDSILLHSGKYNILVDTGGVSYGESNLSNNTLIPLFKSLGIRKIDYLFLSHGDFDHLGEAGDLIRDFRVDRVYFNEGEFNSNEKEIINLLEKKNIFYSISYEGSYYQVGEFKIYSLGTDLGEENDSSMILYGFIENYSFLLMGDSSVKSEEILLSKYDVSNVDFLKVGHHGSKTSSGIEFINAIKPKYSLISVGLDNKFGHPNKEVLNNLKDSIIYRTDQNGSIMLKIKNNKLKVETCEP